MTTTHGMTETPTYLTWTNMKTRCYNKNNAQYPSYGGRGIRICKRWKHSFQNFIDDMGPKPPDRTIDRINNNKGYHPGNCRWATRKEQADNRRSNRVITYKGKTQNLVAWSDELKLSYAMLNLRIQRRGWTTKEAFEIPKGVRRANYEQA